MVQTGSVSNSLTLLSFFHRTGRFGTAIPRLILHEPGKYKAVDLLSIGVTGFSGRCTFTAKSPDGTTSISDHRGLKPFSQSKSTTSVEATLFYDTPLLRRLGSE